MSQQQIVTPPPSASRDSSYAASATSTSPKPGLFKRFRNKTSPSSSKSRNSTTSSESSTAMVDHSIASMPTPRRQGSSGSRKSAGQRDPSVTRYLDFDNSSLYDDDAYFDEDGANHDSDDDDDSSTSNLSLKKTTSLETLDKHRSEIPHFDDHMFNEKVNFPSLEDTHFDDIPLEIQKEEEPPWVGMTYEYLLTPKYVKTSKRNKRSPRILNNVFLAQELNYSEDLKKNSITDFEGGSVVSDTSDRDTAPEAGIDVELSEKTDAANKNEIFVMEFSRDGKYLATAGENATIVIWKVVSSPLGRLEFKNTENELNVISKAHHKKHDVYSSAPVFHQKPFKVLHGHTKGILTLDWSKNNFLLSGSMDRTAKLWHVERDTCLQTFQHEDFVTTAKFHPTDDRFFLSGSLDNHARLWSILETKVAYSKNLGDDVLITASQFTPDGRYIIIGGFNGSLFVLETKGLYHVNRFEIKDRSMVNPFHNKNGNKITGIKIFNNSNYKEGSTTKELDKWSFLITTNDSKVRLVHWSSKRLVTRFKGLTNSSSSIAASMSDDQHYIISGSEDHWCYIWENNNRIINNKLKASLKDLVIEGKHHLHDLHTKHKKYSKVFEDNKYIKKLFENDEQDFDFVSNENNSYASFHAHHSKVNVAIFAPEATKRLLEFSDDIILDLVKRGKACQFKSTGTLPQEDVLTKGEIIVTTDQMGLIRVFRQDSAYKIRKRFINMYKKGPCAPTKKEAVDIHDPIMGGKSNSSSISNLKDMNNCVTALKMDVGRKLTKSGRSMSPIPADVFSLKKPSRKKASSSPVLPTQSPSLSSKNSHSSVPTVFTTGSFINGKQHLNVVNSGLFGEEGMKVDLIHESIEKNMTDTENEQASLLPASSISTKLDEFPTIENKTKAGLFNEALELNFRTPSENVEERVQNELSKLRLDSISSRGREK
ncbi:WD40-repeat-containing domain protein [Scheffersomyces coipomensis]|uniref:WD40-repeat-containing domain protein n=1 Tax=Scheffersomyces coipomensis TaxID=1788519 RepID=UPI00315CE6AC